MKWFYDNVLKPIGAVMSGEIPDAIDTTKQSYDDLGVSIQQAGEELTGFDKYMHDLALDTETNKEQNLLYLASINKLNLAIGMTNERLELMVEYMQDADREQKQLLKSNFELVADTYGLANAMKYSNEEISLLGENLRKYKEYLDDAAKSARGLKEATEPEERKIDPDDISFNKGMSGELGKARAKYPGVDLIKIGSNWLPKDVTVARRNMNEAQSALDRYKRRIDGNWSRNSLENLRELQERAETTRSEYEQAKINLQVIVNERAGGGYDVEARLADSRNSLRMSSQVISS